MWPRRNLQDLLGIEHPIIQAPMSGITTPELVSAVCNAGALGSLGCGLLPSELVREQVAAVRTATDRPFNLNFFAHPRPSMDNKTAAEARQRVQRYYDELGLGTAPEPTEPFPIFDSSRLALVLELRPRVVSFHFGLPGADALNALKQAGCLILSSATTVAEARWLEAAGVDAIIAQGAEAGGHRGTFTDDAGAGTVGAMVLVPRVVDAVRVPVIAAGGIFDGRGIEAAFKLGASGVQMGTAFLGCPESNVPPPYREALRAATDLSTHVTRMYTGRPARVLRNRFSSDMAASDALVLDFPLQASLTMPLGRSADGEVRSDFFPMWAGQGASAGNNLPAGEFVRRLANEAQEKHS
ncbi:NAD(P)H-dependent flavin oxidoreductase [Ensifer aridi]|uniref:NAD(P)H-dependent flavin oxidoreductase n=1 Tax=Ensifer aridi TaxID=1708715 RepID=UPI000A111C46|nr:nitronate monooxygenase family protein [Ensifer aridi]